MKTVLVTGARSPASLDIARDFASAGYEVHMADSAPARISRWSRAPTQVHRVRPPVQDADGFRRDVSRLVADLHPELVVPTCEEVFHLASAREDGMDMGTLLAPGMDTLDILHAKDRFAQLARDLGLDVPETVTLTSQDEVEHIDGSDVVLKACYSRFGVDALVRPTEAQMRRVAPTRGRPWVAQRHMTGVEHSSYAVAVQGRVTLFAAYRSTMRLGGGAGYAFRQAETVVALRMLDATIRLAGHLGMTGQMSLDAIDDGRRTWLIECNPRATSGAHLVSGDGAIARAMIGEDNLGARIHADCHNLPMMFSPGALNTEGCWSAMRRGRDVIGKRGDRWPVAGAVADAMGYAIDSIRHGISMTGATTRDIEWNGTR